MATALFEFFARLVALSFSAFFVAAGVRRAIVGVLLLQARALRESLPRVAYPGISFEQLACAHSHYLPWCGQSCTEELGLNSWLHRGASIEQSVASWTRAWQSIEGPNRGAIALSRACYLLR